MPRQFFVGGNFKMNPGSVEQKKNIIDILNKADLDPSTGTCPTTYDPSRRTQGPSAIRGRHRTPCTLPYSPQDPRPQGDSARCSELLLQVIRRLHGRNQVKRISFMVYSSIHRRLLSPAQLVDAEIPYVILGTSMRPSFPLSRPTRDYQGTPSAVHCSTKPPSLSGAKPRQL